ncbi:DUF4062 domain-containing protein [Aneurinibacillus sp. Ricciae_BoGa-3]|uniref:DUF4062 domain-containing protein n=1 Tax=Aneurinibacillus sp. Ricciae_BoGa-3 TaxID=3022697 RepID=UPI003FA4A296
MKFGGGVHGQSSIEYCLEQVRACDIYFLIIESSSGSMVSGVNRTITHLWFESHSNGGKKNTNRYFVT